MKKIGRILNIRNFKKIIFIKLINIKKNLQIVIKKNIKKIKKKIKIGYVIKVYGKYGKTKSGEKSIFCKKIKILSKCNIFPNKYFKNVSKELSYRKRYVDLVINKKSRYVFNKRFNLIKNIRKFFYKKKFTEVETPILNKIYSGADAEPFITNHNFLKKKNYLRISPELNLKKLIVGGYEKIFEIGKNFRNEGCSKIHNPEFSMVEYYYVDKNYLDIMKFTKKMIKNVVKKTIGKKKIIFDNKILNFNKFKILKIKEALFKYKKINNISKNFLIKKILKKTKILSYKKKNLIYQYFDEFISKKIIEPTFIIGHPKIFSPLALERKGIVERFELFIAGMEIANGFSELNIAKEQKKRFEKQKNDYDIDFIKALKFGLPKTAGCGVGIDRLVMLLTNCKNIKDVILFPFMK
ncbi:OB-fold nucleic acid binding domain-containing protein [Candidatus Vidania fulgoroideae]|uniref:Lysyl-tRNA synthetase n=1 Tax=Candidatus Vidania fulgoroideorum TaxID=881286 RepID=A0AAX3N8D7_9PROT|nr:OB-fold nucleic acid binding domain-containing protein [Candidatus Vidania fulgoroideae]